MGMRSFWLLAALAASLLAGGCASTPRASADLDARAKRFEAPPDGLSRLYIYRNELLGMLAGLDLSVDGRPAGTTKGKTYVIADVPAGPHVVVSEGEDTSSLNVNTQAGQSVFVWQEVKMGAFRARSRLALVTPEQGRAGVLESELVESALMRKDGAPGAAPAGGLAPAAAAPATAAPDAPAAAATASLATRAARPRPRPPARPVGAGRPPGPAPRCRRACRPRPPGQGWSPSGSRRPAARRAGRGVAGSR